MMQINWDSIKKYEDIKYERGLNNAKGIGKISINRPEVRNAFRPQTVFELKDALSQAREDQTIGVIILTGVGEKAFCSGGDQKIRGDAGYIGNDGVPRLNILDVQKQIRYMPKPIIAIVICCFCCWILCARLFSSSSHGSSWPRKQMSRPDFR